MTPSSRRKLGLAFILIPPVCLIGSPILFAIANFVLSSAISAGSSGNGALLAGRVINVALGFFGMIGLLGIFTLFPIGLYLFFSTPKNSTVLPPNPPSPPQT